MKINTAIHPIPQQAITEISLELTVPNLKLHSSFPVANELITVKPLV